MKRKMVRRRRVRRSFNHYQMLVLKTENCSNKGVFYLPMYNGKKEDLLHKRHMSQLLHYGLQPVSHCTFNG